MTSSGKGSPKTSVAVVALVATIYIFFLLFAQFGFLRGIRSSGHDADTILVVLGAMALGGIAASFLTPVVASRLGCANTIALGMSLGFFAATTAGFSFSHAASSAFVLAVTSLATGSGIGLATVALAADFRRLTRGRNIALHAGVGTGIAYLFCNVPVVFESTPVVNAWISAVVALIGAGLTMLLHSVEPFAESQRSALDHRMVTTRGIARVTIAFLALVWFDSAAFSALQNSPGLRAEAWSGAGRLFAIGIAHAVAGIVAGLLLDRGRFRTTLLGAFGCLAAGSLLFNVPGVALAGPVYAVGVSLYSTALAVFAALAPAEKGTVPPIWRAAWVFALAGWVGSVAGVGLAEQFGALPSWAAPATAVALVLALLTGAPSHRSVNQPGESR